MKPLLKTFKAGASIFHENDKSRELYIIQTGSIKVFRKIGTREIEIAILSKGSVLGEMALIDGKPRSASAKTIEETTVILIDADSFHEKIKGVPPWFLSIVKMTSQKIRQANKRLQIISSEHQLINVILILSYEFMTLKGSDSLDFNKTKQKTMHLLGTNYHNVIQAIELLEKNAFISVYNNTLKLQHKKNFYEFCAYLRFLIRKSYENQLPLSEPILKLIELIIEENNSNTFSDDESIEITGDYFHLLLVNSNLHENSTAIIALLKEIGIITMVKKEQTESLKKETHKLTIKINASLCWRIYLFQKYSHISELTR